MKTFTLQKFSKRIIKAGTFLTLGAMMMGNEGCPQDPAVAQGRQLRRRVQMGAVTTFAPSFRLPADAGGGTFNFDYAANAQLQRVLRSSQTFSTVGVFVDPSSVSEADKAEFYQCSQKNPTRAFEFSEEAACMVNMPQAKVNVAITNFQFIGGAGLDIGLLDFGALKGVSFNYKQARLTMELQANDPLILDYSTNQGQTLAAVSAKSYYKDVGGKVTLGFGSISLGLGGYLTSDMANVVEQAMTSGLTDLRSDWDKNDGSMGLSGGWYAMVMKNCDTGILINAGNGADAGLVKEDIVAIYDMAYDWAGPVCHSQLRGVIPATDEPAAYAKITSVGNTISRAQVIQNDPNYPINMNVKIKPGARVYLKKWAPVAATAATK